MNIHESRQKKNEEARHPDSPVTTSNWETIYRRHFTPPAQGQESGHFKKLSLYDEDCVVYISDSTEA